MTGFWSRFFVCVSVLHLAACSIRASTNYDEAKVAAYALPDPLQSSKGERIKDARAWHRARRPEILELFKREVYGRSPGRAPTMTFHVTAVDPKALNGSATRKCVSVRFSDRADGPAMEIVLYLPNGVSGPVPVFVGIHLFDKKDDYPRPGVSLVSRKRGKLKSGALTSAQIKRLPGKRLPEVILERGYGFATIDAAGLAPDSAKDFAKGVIWYYRKPGQKERAPDAWGAIGAWAWGLCRAVDYFETDRAVDHEKVIVIGHSRMGKTALWAGAQDERFAMVISNNSGCGGAALSRRRFGETVAIINKVFPHWFCENFRRYNDKEDSLPVDQHMLIALIAPRPVYIASAEKDRWADPRGEFLSGVHAEPVYRLLGTSGIGSEKMPVVNQRIGKGIGYHIRSGGHDLTDYDWMQYLDFADEHFR